MGRLANIAKAREVILEPLRLERQIEDAISGYRPIKELAEKIRLAQQGKILKVNGSKVFCATIRGENLYYRLSASGPEYYYPMQYARIVLTQEVSSANRSL